MEVECAGAVIFSVRPKRGQRDDGIGGGGRKDGMTPGGG